MICAKCGLEDVNEAESCPRCTAAPPGAGPDRTVLISEDFLLGNTKAGLERIRARLLDLTNRNRLLNFRHTPRSSLSIVGALPDDLFETLTESEAISFKPVPEPKTDNPKPKVVDYARQLGLPTSVDLPEPTTLPVVRGRRAGQVQTLHFPSDLEAILRRISYAARTAIEESGTKMLHLILGFLEWYESDTSDQPHLAPLLLIPVTIEKCKADRASGTFLYEITYSSADQIEENLSLREKLKRDFGLDMPDLAEDETPERYFVKFQAILSAKPRWRIRRRATLGLVYFGKLLMFRDLDPKNWPKDTDLIDHPRISDLFEGTKAGEAFFAEEYPIDAPEQQQRLPPLIHDADSSQHSALIDASEGKNLVIEGPPGTGKSQTITNLIALALAKGQTVLFVSEKLAALEVVRRRLDQAGLGLFCLELHSHKTDKRKLLDELEERLSARGSFRAPRDVTDKRTLLERAKQQLSRYAELINTPFSALGCTGFDIIWRRERLRQTLPFDPNLIEKIRVNRDRTTRLVDFESDCEVLDIYGRHLAEMRQRFSDIQTHPWHHVSNAALDYSGERELLRTLEQVVFSAREIRVRVTNLAAISGLAADALAALDAMAHLVTCVAQLPDPQDAATKAILDVAANPNHERVLHSLVADVGSWKSDRVQLTEKIPSIAQDKDPAIVEPLRLACEKAIEFGLGNLDRLALANLAAECESLRGSLLETSVLRRDSLLSNLSTCESATILSRFRREYRLAKRAFKETFVRQKRPRRDEMTRGFRRAFLLLDKLHSDEDFAARHQGLLSYSDLETLIDTARSAVSRFESFDVSDSHNARSVLASVGQFSSSCATATAIANGHPARGLIATYFQGVETNLRPISEAIAAVGAIRRAKLPEAIESWLLRSDTSARLSRLGTDCTKLDSLLRPMDTALARFSELGQVDPELWWGPKPWTLSELERVAEGALEKEDALSGWLELRRAIRDVEAAKLSEIATLGDSRAIDIRDMVTAYTYVFYNTLAQQLTRDQPQLLQFSGLRQEAVRERFVQLDQELIKLNRQTAALLTSQRVVPPGVRSGPVSQLTDEALIKQEIAKKKRHVPIRQLIRRAGRALQALKPCFMMGPLSVAQYIEPGRLKFDLVVMDEASQLKPEDALGAIARGGQLVVVGDPKQLPPSTFFERQLDLDPDSDAEEDTSSVEEHESILDVANALYQPIRQLRWHYRSRHDSLIAFSNAEFYRNRLLVFPSPTRASAQTGIQFQHIANGLYESGGAKWNRPEAERVVSSIADHMQTFPDLSLGVVALNYQQRELIDELLTTRARTDAMVQQYIERHREAYEPFFIKNLENVQGDERDVIFVSVTYGRDRNRNLFQRFGPINQAQGPRRLNVLFTRAKHRIVVFSSIDPDEIRIDPSTPRGVGVLKSYLNYAKTGRLETETYTKSQPTNDFEAAVSHALTQQGFECVPQVGVQGFFIDLAVRHPERPGVFVLGIECDGATYHSAKSARDRDRLRQAILENLGWKIHRIWSTDWFKDSRRETERVVERIRQILANEPPATIGRRGEVQGTTATETSVETTTDHDAHLPRYQPERTTANSVPRSAWPNNDRLTTEDARRKLIELRENVIKKAFPNVDPARGLLRKSMLEALLRVKPGTREEWLAGISYDLRSGTDPEQVGKYLDAVLAIVSRVSF